MTSTHRLLFVLCPVMDGRRLWPGRGPTYSTQTQRGHEHTGRGTSRSTVREALATADDCVAGGQEGPWPRRARLPALAIALGAVVGRLIGVDGKGGESRGPRSEDSSLADGAKQVHLVTAQPWPSPEQWARADLVVAFCYMAWNEQRMADVRGF